MRRLSVILSLLLLAPNRKKDLVLVFGLVFALFGSTPGLSQHGQSSNEVTVAQSRPADQPTQSGTPAQSTSESDMLDRPTAHGRFGPERLSKGQLAKEVAAQKRVATYFHDKVTTRLKSCWDSLKGTGDIRMEYTFARRDKYWMPEKVILAHSTVLDDEQNRAALKCMEDAVKDTPLPIDSGDADTKDFFISWSWPVPMPKDAEQQYKTMLLSIGGGGGGGCDGRGTPPRCSRCVGDGSCASCVTVCVGYSSCSFSSSGGVRVGCFNDPPTQCVSGGQGADVSSGLVIY
jgi:hypothetical protein